MFRLSPTYFLQTRLGARENLTDRGYSDRQEMESRCMPSQYGQRPRQALQKLPTLANRRDLRGVPGASRDRNAKTMERLGHCSDEAGAFQVVLDGHLDDRSSDQGRS